MMDALDALFLIRVIDRQHRALADAADQDFLDTLADEFHEGRTAPLTEEELRHLQQCAREVAIGWVDPWVRALKEERGV